MSRFGDGEPAEYSNASELWERNAMMALSGKRGQQALRDLREALLALPQRRLIEGAICTVGLEERVAEMPETVDYGRGSHRNYERQTLEELLATQGGEGVCAIGAYAWYMNVKNGMTPEEAFDVLPVGEEDDYATAELGRKHGLTWTLAWELAYLNDERLEGLTPEARFERFIEWIDDHLLEPVA